MVVHYKPSILIHFGVPLFLETPIYAYMIPYMYVIDVIGQVVMARSGDFLSVTFTSADGERPGRGGLTWLGLRGKIGATPWNCVRPQGLKSESDSISQEIFNRTHWGKDPSIALATYLRTRLVRSHSIFDGYLACSYFLSMAQILKVCWSNLVKFHSDFTRLGPPRLVVNSKGQGNGTLYFRKIWLVIYYLLVYYKVGLKPSYELFWGPYLRFQGWNKHSYTFVRQILGYMKIIIENSM